MGKLWCLDSDREISDVRTEGRKEVRGSEEQKMLRDAFNSAADYPQPKLMGEKKEKPNVGH